MRDTVRQWIREARRIAVLTGAGTSAESGVPTFRDAQTGLWAKFRPEDLATPEAFLFIAFRVPYSPAIGIKLISTPWTDQNLEYAEGITAEQLRQEHRNKGMPDDLANILELAGQADVRILILDADAPALAGLPLAEHW